MKVEKVSVGLVGLGMVCESHLKAYSAHPDAEVLAVCDLDADRSKEIANKYGIPRTYTSYEQMLKDSEICLLYTSPSPRDATLSRMPSSA